MKTALRAIANKAANKKSYRFQDLYRMLNEENLTWAFYQLRKDAASGVDNVTYHDYESDLEENIVNLVYRLRKKRYRKTGKTQNYQKAEREITPTRHSSIGRQNTPISGRLNIECDLRTGLSRQQLCLPQRYERPSGARRPARGFADGKVSLDCGSRYTRFLR